MNKLMATARHEFVEMLPPTIFFFVILHLVVIIRALMTRGTGLSLPTTASVTVAALILGKSVLLANHLPFVNRFPDKPLVWNAGWKTLIYTLVALCFHYLEHLYDYWKDSPNLFDANRTLLAQLNWSHFWAIQILLVTLIANYCVFAELGHVIGRDKLKAIFLGPLPARPARKSAS
ncbi:hypothetical protein AAGS40_05515 [Paraburkholderia sp. PREW-6R]|uniref:hypothetical protein n=1 Tax=Paraburkholderia sp. PREW-6R TaxID=3141544 RepID=UPI0031F5647B